MKQRTSAARLHPCLLLAMTAGSLFSAHAAHAAKHTEASRPERIEACVSEHDEVSVSGEIRRKRYKGASHDVDSYARSHSDTAVVLKLTHPLCVMLPDDINATPRPHNVREVQLLAEERLPKSSDTKRQVEGTVQLAQTRYHHLPVLIEVRELRR